MQRAQQENTFSCYQSLQVLNEVTLAFTKHVQLWINSINIHHHTTTTVLWSFFRDHTGEPVPEENFWTLWCKGRLTEADTLKIQLGATPSGLTSAHLHHPPIFCMGQMPFLLPNQQCQSTEGNIQYTIYSYAENMITFVKNQQSVQP